MFPRVEEGEGSEDAEEKGGGGVGGEIRRQQIEASVFTRRVHECWKRKRGGEELGCIQASNNIRISKAEHRRRGRKPTRI